MSFRGGGWYNSLIRRRVGKRSFGGKKAREVWYNAESASRGLAFARRRAPAGPRLVGRTRALQAGRPLPNAIFSRKGGGMVRRGDAFPKTLIRADAGAIIGGCRRMPTSGRWCWAGSGRTGSGSGPGADGRTKKQMEKRARDDFIFPVPLFIFFFEAAFRMRTVSRLSWTSAHFLKLAW